MYKLCNSKKNYEATFRKILALLMVLSIGTLSWADSRSTQKSLGVTLTVADVFGFVLWRGQESQTLYPGSEPFTNPLSGEVIDRGLGKVNILVSTNRGIPWIIKAESPGCFKESSQTGYGQTGYGSTLGVPLVITTFGDNLTGTRVKDLVLNSNAQNIYMAGPEEMNVFGLEIAGIFFPKAAAYLSQGTYRGYIRLTLIEAVPSRGTTGPPR